jgi:hypothetical protein
MLTTHVPTEKKKIFPILLPSMVKAEKVSDHPHMPLWLGAAEELATMLTLYILTPILELNIALCE